MEARWKRSFTGQKGYILLTDLAHNLLADFAHHGLDGSSFAGFSLKRIVRDLLKMPGLLSLGENQVQSVQVTLSFFSTACGIPGLRRKPRMLPSKLPSLVDGAEACRCSGGLDQPPDLPISVRGLNDMAFMEANRQVWQWIYRL